jgi:hypothetical protein
MLFLSGWDFGLVFSRQVCYRLVGPFSTPVDSPRDKRGKSRSRNHVLGIGIRADNAGFPEVVFCGGVV